MKEQIFNIKQQTFPFSSLAILKSQGISKAKALSEWRFFTKILPPLPIRKPCVIGDGVISLSLSEVKKFASLYQHASARLKVVKFVPASGEGSRMFASLLYVREKFPNLNKTLLENAAKKGDDECRKSLLFFQNLERLAFFDLLKKALLTQGFQVDTLLKSGKYTPILDCLLSRNGLNYSKISKGSIVFHRNKIGTRTAFEEHLLEARETIRNEDGTACVHFTVSPDHVLEMRAWFKKNLRRYEHPGSRLQVAFSTQSGNTLAVDLKNIPFRDSSGNFLFRAGGHGALLSNLNRLASHFEMIFLKNIDNVTTDSQKKIVYLYKKALAGFLLDLRNKIFGQMKVLKKKKNSEKELRESFNFLKKTLCVLSPKSIQAASPREQKKYLLERLNRPLRVCGMVKNAGEPGGGPFWVDEKDGTLSLQIVEASQAVTVEQKEIFQKSTHFNPVDLVCWVRDFDGNPFDLRKFVDPDTAFIVKKTYLGKPLKALELPGLWNGSMAFWNTVFVEVPLNTFCPVKTVFDLLKPEHCYP